MTTSIHLHPESLVRHSNDGQYNDTTTLPIADFSAEQQSLIAASLQHLHGNTLAEGEEATWPIILTLLKNAVEVTPAVIDEEGEVTTPAVMRDTLLAQFTARVTGTNKTTTKSLTIETLPDPIRAGLLAMWAELDI